MVTLVMLLVAVVLEPLTSVTVVLPGSAAPVIEPEVVNNEGVVVEIVAVFVPLPVDAVFTVTVTLALDVFEPAGVVLEIAVMTPLNPVPAIVEPTPQVVGNVPVNVKVVVPLTDVTEACVNAAPAVTAVGVGAVPAVPVDKVFVTTLVVAVDEEGAFTVNNALVGAETVKVKPVGAAPPAATVAN